MQTLFGHNQFVVVVFAHHVRGEPSTAFIRTGPVAVQDGRKARTVVGGLVDATVVDGAIHNALIGVVHDAFKAVATNRAGPVVADFQVAAVVLPA